MDPGSLSEVETLLMVLKVLLASLSVILLFGFFIQWKISKYRLPVIAFYMKKRFVKHNVILGTGVVSLSLAYITDFLMASMKPGSYEVGLVIGVLEVIALACIGYSYYKLVRLQIPT